MKPGTGSLLGAAFGVGYFALVERDRTPGQARSAYLMPDSTDWLAILGSGALLYAGFKRCSPIAAGAGATIGVVHVAKLVKKAEIRRGVS